MKSAAVALAVAIATSAGISGQAHARPQDENAFRCVPGAKPHYLMEDTGHEFGNPTVRTMRRYLVGSDCRKWFKGNYTCTGGVKGVLLSICIKEGTDVAVLLNKQYGFCVSENYRNRPYAICQKVVFRNLSRLTR